MTKLLALIRQSKSEFLLLAIVFFFLGSFVIVSSEVREAMSGEKELITEIDRFLLETCLQLRRPWSNAIAVDITALGSTTILTLLTCIVILFSTLRRRFDFAAHMFLAVTGAGIFSLVLKNFFGRERPTLIEKIVQVKGHSYPSGHSLGAAAVYITIAILACTLVSSRSLKIAIVSVAGTLVTMIGLSRIYLGVHFPTDVLAGLLLGTSWALLIAVVFPRLKKWAKK